MWTWIIILAVIAVVATLIMRRQREWTGTGTPADIRARAGKARKLDGSKPGGFSGKPGGNSPGMPG